MIQPYNIECEPSPSVPAETLLQDGWDTFLLFWSVSKTVDPGSGYLKDLGVAILECKGTVSTRFGYPNDEGLPEHPFYEDGLCNLDTSIGFTPESQWLLDINSQMQASANRILNSRNKKSSTSQEELLHFIISLKEATFECIAERLVVVAYVPDFDEAFKYVIQRFSQH